MTRLGGFLLCLVSLLVGCQSSLDRRSVSACIEADELFQQGKVDEVIGRYDPVKVRDEDLNVRHLILAAAWSHKQNPSKVEASLRDYLAVQPGHAVAYLYLAEVLRQQNRWDAAESAYRSFLAADRSYTEKGVERRRVAYGRLIESAEKDGDESKLAQLHALLEYDEVACELSATEQTRGNVDWESACERLAEAMKLLQDARPESEDKFVVDLQINDISDLLGLAEARQKIEAEKLPWPASRLDPDAAEFVWEDSLPLDDDRF